MGIRFDPGENRQLLSGAAGIVVDSELSVSVDVRSVFFLIRYTIDDPGLKMVMGDECPVSQAVSCFP